MNFEELKTIYVEKGPHDRRILTWILKNIERYITRKRYPQSLCPPPSTGWNEEAFTLLRNDFVSGRRVRDRKTGEYKTILDFNLPEIFDRCDSIEGANALIQQQIHFFFQKTRDVGIKENIVRRVKELCEQDPKLNGWKTGSSITYGLRRWRVSDPGTWQGSDADLYHLVYANLGEYVPKTYGEHSAYNSPEIGNTDLTKFLANIFSAADKRLTMSQVLYVLGYVLELNEVQPESLDQETEKKHALLETLAADVETPEQVLMDQEEDTRYSTMADSFYSALPNHLQDLLTYILQNKGSLEEFSTQKDIPLSTLYHQRDQIRNRFTEFVKTPYEQRIVQQKLLAKLSPRESNV